MPEIYETKVFDHQWKGKPTFIVHNSLHDKRLVCDQHVRLDQITKETGTDRTTKRKKKKMTQSNGMQAVENVYCTSSTGKTRMEFRERAKVSPQTIDAIRH